MTNYEKYNALATYFEGGVLNGEDEITEGFTYAQAAELMRKNAEALAKKSSKNSAKSEEIKEENAALADSIYYHMTGEPGRKFTLDEMVREFPECADLTTAKVRSAMKGLLGKGAVKTEKVKGKVVFFTED